MPHFKKINVPSGATVAGNISVQVRELAYYDEKKGWTVEPGEYTFYIGSSSRDVRGQVDVSIN